MLKKLLAPILLLLVNPIRSVFTKIKSKIIDTMMSHTISPTLAYIVARRSGISNNNRTNNDINPTDDMISGVLSFVSAWKAYIIANKGRVDTNDSL